MLTCDVSAGIGLIIGSQKLISCAFTPKGSGRREDYDGVITKYGLDLGLTSGGFMVWAVFAETVAGLGFLAGDYVGASGEVTVVAGLGANVLVGGSNRTVPLQPISITGQRGLNLAVGVAALHLGRPGNDPASARKSASVVSTAARLTDPVLIPQQNAGQKRACERSHEHLCRSWHFSDETISMNLGQLTGAKQT